MSSDVTLANGVFVSEADRREAHDLVDKLCDHAQHVLGEEVGQPHGIVWEVVGYVHGHRRTIPSKWHYTLKTLGIMEENGTIPLARQWAMVSLCRRRQRLGKYAKEKVHA